MSRLYYRCQYHMLYAKVPIKNTKGKLGHRTAPKHFDLQQHEKLQSCRVECSSKSLTLSGETAAKFKYIKYIGFVQRRHGAIRLSNKLPYLRKQKLYNVTTLLIR